MPNKSPLNYLGDITIRLERAHAASTTGVTPRFVTNYPRGAPFAHHAAGNREGKPQHADKSKNKTVVALFAINSVVDVGMQ